MKKITIAIVQPKVFYDSKKNTKENNLTNAEHAVQLLKKFKRNEIDLIIFPELYPGNINQLKKETSRLNSYIIAGEKYKKHNSATIITPSKKILGRHFKINLWRNESKFGIIPGKRIKVFNIKNRKIGILICADFWKPKIIMEEIKRGTEILIVPSSVVPAFLDMWRHNLIFQAYINSIPIIFVNYVLFRGIDAYWGGGKSKILIPFRKLLTWKEINNSKKSKFKPSHLVLKELGEKEEVFKCTLDLEKYNKFREKMGE